MAIEFPRTLLRERSHSWNLVGTAMSSASALGVAPVVRTDGGGFWSCVMSDVRLSGIKGADLRGRQRQKQATLLWRAVRQLCDGGVRSIIVPRNDALFRPFPPGVKEYGLLPHSDASFFSDASGYYQAVVNIETASAAALRATSIALRTRYGAQLRGGESFAIEHAVAGWRIYEIATVDQVDDAVSIVTFNPPLREAVASGVYVEFDRPRCLMRLAKTSSMDLTVQPWTFNSGSLDFVEAPW